MSHHEILALPVEEKLELVRELWDSIAADEAKTEVSEEAKAEIRQRMEAYRRGELKAESWEQMRSRLRN